MFIFVYTFSSSACCTEARPAAKSIWSTSAFGFAGAGAATFAGAMAAGAGSARSVGRDVIALFLS